MDFDPLSGKLWIGENGVYSNDEINLVEPGFNGGWKDITGFAPANLLSTIWSLSMERETIAIRNSYGTIRYHLRRSYFLTAAISDQSMKMICL
jgi:glucose/arabinose dehydrogenase